jgi:hypothetical protein
LSLLRGDLFWGAMSLENKIYQVFISSTFTDLQEERRAVAEAISKSGQIPAGMEYFPASSQKQFEYIKKIIDRCDYYVLIIAGKYGTMSPSGISYTEEEYNYATSKGIPVLAFINNEVGKIPSEKVETDKEKLDKLQNFRDEVASSRIVEFWKDSKELPGKVAIAVAQEINLNPGIGWIRGDQAIDPKIYEENRNLRQELQSYKQTALPLTFSFPPNLPNITEEFQVSVHVSHYSKGPFGENQNLINEQDLKFNTSWESIFLKLSNHLQNGIENWNLKYRYIIYCFDLDHLINDNEQIETISDLNLENMINLFISYELMETTSRQNTNSIGSSYYSVYILTEKGKRYSAFLKYGMNGKTLTASGSSTGNP